jgi:osmotically inducible lipoprotein OsmB
MILRTTFTIAVCVMLAACGSSKGDRALSGGAIGAGVGAVGGAIVGGDPATGAVVGGAVGAGIGAMTDEDDIDLDD